MFDMWLFETSFEDLKPSEAMKTLVYTAIQDLLFRLEDYDTVCKENDDLSLELDEANSDIASLETDVSYYEGQYDRAVYTIDSQETDLEKATYRINELINRVNQLESDLEESEADSRYYKGLYERQIEDK